MVVTDPIADMLTRIRNANRVYHPKVDIPASKIKKEISRILKTEGFIKDYKYVKNGARGTIRIFLKYGKDKTKIINGLRRVSKPGLRVYVTADNIPKVMGGLGIAILSTSKGVMTGKQSKEANVGGEVLAYVW